MYIENLLTISLPGFNDAESTSAFGIIKKNMEAISLKWHFAPSKPDRDYTNKSLHYQRLKDAKVHVIDNSTNAIDNSTALEILFAMTQQKPIILINQPSFTKDVDLFSREIILSRLNKMLLCDLTMLDETDLFNFLNNSTAPVNYVITKHQDILIRSKLRTYFRSLLKI